MSMQWHREKKSESVENIMGPGTVCCGHRPENASESS